MGSVVADRERILYEDVFDTVAKYAVESPGRQNVEMFLDMARPVLEIGDCSALDAGCGGGFGAIALKDAGFSKVAMCDITDFGLSDEARTSNIPFYQVCLWDSLHSVAGGQIGRKFDYVYCCDVLEHIPKEFTMLVASRLLEITRFGLFMSISHVRDVHGAWVGRPLHATVESFTWWRDNLSAIGDVAECRDLLSYGLFLVRPRR